jgi:hypothetical protein
MTELTNTINELELSYRECIDSSGIAAIVEKVQTPTHLPASGDFRLEQSILGCEFMDLVYQFRDSHPKDSPSLFAFADGKRHHDFRKLLDAKPSWSDDPRTGCHLSLASLGGCTIRLTDVHKMSLKIAILRKVIFETMKGKGETHAFYSTPNCGNAVPYHRDSGIQIIYQVCGRKKWFFDEQHPLIDLNAGDFLIIPLAYIHRAETTDEYSIHLTFMLNPIPELAAIEALTRGFLGKEI